jgi:hypothetical protein
MSKYYLLGLTSFFLFFTSSCKVISYTGYVGQSTQTQVELSEANFNHLGYFTGIASSKKSAFSIKDKAGVISEAKKNLIENAKKAGVELNGSRTLINMTTDVVQNTGRITCTISAEIIEFVKD